MSIVLKAGSGLLAGAVAGALGLAVLPRVEPANLKPRIAVEKPSFVVAAAPAATAPSPTATLAVAAETPTAKPSPTAPVPAEKPSPKAVASNATPEPAKVAPNSANVAPKSASGAETAPVALRGGAEPPTPPEASASSSVRGLVALARGDISSARLFLTRAAEAGDPRAFVALADTYDPALLSKLGVTFAPGDPARAKDYLMKAVAAGVVVPKDRLANLEQAHSELR